MKKVVFKLEYYDEKVKQRAMQKVSGLSGVESITMDMKEKKMTVTGDIDPVKMAARLRKICHTDIVTVGPAKEPEKKKEEPKKEEPKKEEPKKEEPKKMSLIGPPPAALGLALAKASGGGGGPPPAKASGGGGGGDEKKKDVKALVPVSIPAPPVTVHQGHQLVKAFPSEPYHHLQYPPLAAAPMPYGQFYQQQQYHQYPPPLPAPAYYAMSHVEEDPNSCVIC